MCRRVAGDSPGCWAASEESSDEVMADRDARRKSKWRPAIAREIDLGVGSARGLTEDIGKPESALAEPVPEHRDIAVAEVDNTAFARDESRP